MSQKRAEDLERITSEYGTTLRMNRSIQAEGSFVDARKQKAQKIQGCGRDDKNFRFPHPTGLFGRRLNASENIIPSRALSNNIKFSQRGKDAPRSKVEI